MQKLPDQAQLLTGIVEYEFDVAKLLNVGDSISSVVWTVPSQLTLENSVFTGTVIKGFISANVPEGAELYKSYWVSFTINTAGNPTPVSPELSFEIVLVKRIRVLIL